jgi:hypothetical protein
MRVLTFAAIALIFMSGCARYFIASDFNQKTANHKSIAVLPVEMIFTGNQPKNMTKEDIEKIEEAESKAFMVSMYNEILRSTKNGKKSLRVDVQSFTKTISILEEKNISVRQAWNTSPVELANILGVDAVVQSRVTKKRYMSGLASFGIDLGVQILDNLLGGGLWGAVPNQATRTDDIFASFSLVNGTDAAALYSRSFSTEADWNSPANEIIDRITRKFARKFPYRR